MRMNWSKLKCELKSIAAEIRTFKRVLRQPGREITSPEALQLRRWKAEATRLCCIAAHARGRVHRKGGTLTQQAETLGTALAEFEIAEVSVAA